MSGVVRMHVRCAAMLCVLACAGSSGCAARSQPATASTASEAQPAARPADDGLDYRFELAPDLQSLTGRVCPRGRVPRSLGAGGRAGRAWLRAARVEGPSGTRALSVQGAALDLSGMRRGECVVYELDLSAEGARMPPELVRHETSFASNVALWLWRPPDYESYLPARAQVVLPAGVSASLPWERDGEGYRLEASAFAFHGYAAFGAIDIERFAVGSTSIELAVLPGLSTATRGHLEGWVRAAVEAVAGVSGAPPRPRLQLVVSPVASERPVAFGMMTRGGGASACLFVSPTAEREALERDWVLVHELSHLFLPFVERQDAWLSEGLATYYQEVLRARAGLQSPAEAWRRLEEGAQKAAGLSRSLMIESAEVFRTHAFAPVYWGGASYALMVDVELRRQSGGRASLDSVIADLMRCCSAAVEPWSAEEIMAHIDESSGTTIARDVFERVVRVSRFPDLRDAFVRLGVPASDAPAPSDAWIGEAIMRRAVEAQAVSALQVQDAAGRRKP